MERTKKEELSNSEPERVDCDVAQLKRRSFFAGVASAILLTRGALAGTPARRPDVIRERKLPTPEEFLAGLSNKLEDIYLLLFEPNQFPGGDDEFIAEAAKFVGYGAPYHWHSEVMYFYDGKWMVMGCRPSKCEKDFPLSDLLSDPSYAGSKVNVRHARVPKKSVLETREFFTRVFEQRPYSLNGPSKKNCADAALALAQKADIGGSSKVRVHTRRELIGIPKINKFLKRWNRPEIKDFLRRDDLVFPDALEDLGRGVGSFEVPINKSLRDNTSHN